ncbi:hypothetical protein COW46_02400 [Candidatus Gracilibacteria bacterium CG17_big_fil_post_rev_8_21_14_2_50_48_13]|nr:MAG: hypothetical protein COW46_02400 [Candidatus Gracilibacteria bacterium CG17_big_fil_post_rev_8_21_14_2_50_48_13]
MVTPIELLYHIEPLAEGNDKQVFVIQFKGELDESNIDNTAKEVYKLLDESANDLPVLFDFSELGYMNSKSIGYLSDWYTRLGEKGSELLVAAAPENIMDILQTVGLDNFIRMFPSVELAKAALLAPPAA